MSTPTAHAATGTRDKSATLNRVRALLAKAEAEGVTPQEAEALTAKASELMAVYGIDSAMASARADKGEKPDSRVFDIPNPWAQVHTHLLAGIAQAMGCEVVLLSTNGAGGSRLHVFGFEADITRADMMYTSLLLQMASAHHKAVRPEYTHSVRAWNRSWLLGWVSAVIVRVRSVEEAAKATAEAAVKPGEMSTALVLVNRSVAVKDALRDAYPKTRPSRITYSGRGYSDGHNAGQRANIHDRTETGAGSGRSLPR